MEDDSTPNGQQHSARETTSGGAAQFCKVEGCEQPMSQEDTYYRRYNVCKVHLRALELLVDGRIQRFCQQCGKFQDIEEFDDVKRSCRTQLARHSLRRRIKLSEKRQQRLQEQHQHQQQQHQQQQQALDLRRSASPQGGRQARAVGHGSPTRVARPSHSDPRARGAAGSPGRSSREEGTAASERQRPQGVGGGAGELFCLDLEQPPSASRQLESRAPRLGALASSDQEAPANIGLVSIARSVTSGAGATMLMADRAATARAGGSSGNLRLDWPLGVSQQPAAMPEATLQPPPQQSSQTPAVEGPAVATRGSGGNRHVTAAEPPSGPTTRGARLAQKEADADMAAAMATPFTVAQASLQMQYAAAAMPLRSFTEEHEHLRSQSQQKAPPQAPQPPPLPRPRQQDGLVATTPARNQENIQATQARRPGGEVHSQRLPDSLSQPPAVAAAAMSQAGAGTSGGSGSGSERLLQYLTARDVQSAPRQHFVQDVRLEMELMSLLGDLIAQQDRLDEMYGSASRVASGTLPAAVGPAGTGTWTLGGTYESDRGAGSGPSSGSDMQSGPPAPSLVLLSPQSLQQRPAAGQASQPGRPRQALQLQGYPAPRSAVPSLSLSPGDPGGGGSSAAGTGLGSFSKAAFASGSVRSGRNSDSDPAPHTPLVRDNLHMASLAVGDQDFLIPQQLDTDLSAGRVHSGEPSAPAPATMLGMLQAMGGGGEAPAGPLMDWAAGNVIAGGNVNIGGGGGGAYLQAAAQLPPAPSSGPDPGVTGQPMSAGRWGQLPDAQAGVIPPYSVALLGARLPQPESTHPPQLQEQLACPYQHAPMDTSRELPRPYEGTDTALPSVTAGFGFAGGSSSGGRHTAWTAETYLPGSGQGSTGQQHHLQQLPQHTQPYPAPYQPVPYMVPPLPQLPPQQQQHQQQPQQQQQLHGQQEAPPHPFYQHHQQQQQQPQVGSVAGQLQLPATVLPTLAPVSPQAPEGSHHQLPGTQPPLRPSALLRAQSAFSGGAGAAAVGAGSSGAPLPPVGSVAASTSTLHSHSSGQLLQRLSLKLHGCSPADLLPGSRAKLQTWLTSMDMQMLQFTARSGCVLLIADVLVPDTVAAGGTAPSAGMTVRSTAVAAALPLAADDVAGRGGHSSFPSLLARMVDDGMGLLAPSDVALRLPSLPAAATTAGIAASGPEAQAVAADSASAEANSSQDGSEPVVPVCTDDRASVGSGGDCTPVGAATGGSAGSSGSGSGSGTSSAAVPFPVQLVASQGVSAGGGAEPGSTLSPGADPADTCELVATPFLNTGGHDSGGSGAADANTPGLQEGSAGSDQDGASEAARAVTNLAVAQQGPLVTRPRDLGPQLGAQTPLQGPNSGAVISAGHVRGSLWRLLSELLGPLAAREDGAEAATADGAHVARERLLLQLDDQVVCMTWQPRGTPSRGMVAQSSSGGGSGGDGVADADIHGNSSGVGGSSHTSSQSISVAATAAETAITEQTRSVGAPVPGSIRSPPPPSVLMVRPAAVVAGCATSLRATIQLQQSHSAPADGLPGPDAEDDLAGTALLHLRYGGRCVLSHPLLPEDLRPPAQGCGVVRAQEPTAAGTRGEAAQSGGRQGLLTAAEHSFMEGSELSAATRGLSSVAADQQGAPMDVFDRKLPSETVHVSDGIGPEASSMAPSQEEGLALSDIDMRSAPAALAVAPPAVGCVPDSEGIVVAEVTLQLPALSEHGLAFVESSCGDRLGPWVPLPVVPSEAIAAEITKLAEQYGRSQPQSQSQSQLHLFLSDLGRLLMLSAAAACLEEAGYTEDWEAYETYCALREAMPDAPITAGRLLQKCIEWSLPESTTMATNLLLSVLNEPL